MIPTIKMEESENTFRVEAKVAIIGAGPSGLAAGRRLVAACLHVTLIERKNQAGGTWYYFPIPIDPGLRISGLIRCEITGSSKNRNL